MERTIAQQKDQIASSLTNLYNDVLQKQSELATARAAYELAQTKMTSAEQKLQVGTIGRLEYLQQENALKIANWLKEQEEIKEVYYVGLPEHPGYEINKSQARGFGGMISFHTDTAETAKRILERVKVISYAESLGGVESLITYPMLQTHGDVPAEIRERLGITDNFLRMSVGIENGDDLIEDLAQALKGE